MTRVLNVGIDFGTTFSSVFFCRPTDARVMHFENNSPTMPTLFSFYRDMRFGEPVRMLINANPAKTIPSVVTEVKRFLGRSLKDENVRKLLTQTQNTVRDAADVISFQIKNVATKQTYSFDPVDVAALILMDIKRVIDRAKSADEQVRAVVTVPAMFGNRQCDALRRAVAMAGIDLVDLLKEPTAAACAYNPPDGRVLVFDFGGGTLDLSIIEVAEGRQFDVKHTDGNCFLGGNNIDYNFIELLLRKVDEFEDDALSQKVRRRRAELKHICERMKIQFSNDFHTKRRRGMTYAAIVPTLSQTFELDTLFKGRSEEYFDYDVEITYEEFAAANREVFEETRRCVRRALEQSRFAARDITSVLMVGGTCNCPEVYRILTEEFGEAKIIDPKDQLTLLVCKGAAMFCQNRGMLGVESARVGNILTYDIGIRHFDVYQRCYFIETILERNTRLPARKREVCVTIEDFQKSVEFELFENGKPLDVFRIDNIPLQLAHTVEIEVDVLVDSDGTISVTARVIKPSDAACQGQCKVVAQNKSLLQFSTEARTKELQDLYLRFTHL